MKFQISSMGNLIFFLPLCSCRCDCFKSDAAVCTSHLLPCPFSEIDLAHTLVRPSAGGWEYKDIGTHEEDLYFPVCPNLVQASLKRNIILIFFFLPKSVRDKPEFQSVSSCPCGLYTLELTPLFMRCPNWNLMQLLN